MSSGGLTLYGSCVVTIILVVESSLIITTFIGGGLSVCLAMAALS